MDETKYIIKKGPGGASSKITINSIAEGGDNGEIESNEHRVRADDASSAPDTATP